MGADVQSNYLKSAGYISRVYKNPQNLLLPLGEKSQLLSHQADGDTLLDQVEELGVKCGKVIYMHGCDSILYAVLVKY